MSRDSELAWQPWIAALGGLASSAALLATVPFSRFDDVLLFLAWGVALAEAALAATWSAFLLLLLPVALVARRASHAASWASQATRVELCLGPLLVAVPIALNPWLLWGASLRLSRSDVRDPLLAGLAGCVVVLLLRRAIRRVLVARHGRSSLAGGLVVVLLLTGAWGRTPATARPAETVATDPPRVERPRRPVLVVGIDSLGRQTLSQVLAGGDLPTIRGLVDRGLFCGVQGPSTNSCELFASIATCATPTEHGVETHFHVKFPGVTSFPLHERHRNLWIAYALGLPLLAAKAVEAWPPPRDTWRVEPIWTRARAAGLSTAVVGWLGSWPVAERDGDVFPYLGARSSWEVFYRYRPGRFAPGGCFQEQEWRGLVREPSEADDAELAALGLDEGAGVAREERLASGLSLLSHNPAAYVRYEHLGDETHAAIAEDAVRRRRPDLAWVYFGGLDVVEHYFWPQWKPEDYGGGGGRSGPRDRQPVLLYLRWIDAQLARILAAYETEPAVVVVGDHDMRGPGNRLFPAWHFGEGALIVRDPDRAAPGGGATVSPPEVGDLICAICGLGTSARWERSPLKGTFGR